VVCAGGSVRLRASGALTYRWSPPDGLDCTECAEPLARPARTTTYRVEGVSADGCRALDSLTIVVVDTSSADAGADVALCPGESIPLRASGGATYRWSPSAGLSCDTCSDPIARPERTTRYTVFVNESTACGSRDSLLVTVHPPMVVEAGEDAELCDGDSVRLEASGGVRWRWSPAGSLSCVDCRDPVASPETTTRYHVEAWGVEGCTAVDSVLVTVHAPPAIDAGADVVICEGENARLEARGGVGYVWSPTEGLSCSDCSNPLASPARTTHYMLVGTDANGCSGADTVTVSVEPIAIFDLVVPRDLRVAAGDTVLVPVLLASGSTRDLARGLHGLSIQVDERTARIRGITTDGTLLEGAVVSTAKVGVDRLDLRIESLAAAPPSDTLLLVAISAYLGPSDSTEINVWTAVARDRCAQGSATTGVIRVDSICGLGSRLVELLDHGLALRTVRPSPIVDRAEITIATAFDGPARLALSDPAGREVAILLDAVVPAGELMITLETRDLSSGVYTLVLDSNGERRAQRIIVTH
jgi:hypothetical protein